MPTYQLVAITIPSMMGFLVRLHPARLTWTIIVEVWKIIFLSKRVICRFQPLILQGVPLKINVKTWGAGARYHEKRVTPPFRDRVAARETSSLDNLRGFFGFGGGQTISIPTRWALESHGWMMIQFLPHTIHVWYIYLHLVDFYGKCS